MSDFGKVWCIREWYSYGKWNRHIRKTYYVPGDTRRQARTRFMNRYGSEILNREACKITVEPDGMCTIDEPEIWLQYDN